MQSWFNLFFSSTTDLKHWASEKSYMGVILKRMIEVKIRTYFATCSSLTAFTIKDVDGKKCK